MDTEWSLLEFLLWLSFAGGVLWIIVWAEDEFSTRPRDYDEEDY